MTALTESPTIPATVPLEDTIAFFRNQFPIIPEGCFIELRTVRTGGGAMSEWHATAEAAAKAARKHDNDPSINIYHSVNLRLAGGRKKAETPYIVCVHLDLDNKHFSGGFEEAYQRVMALPLEPSLIVRSGHGAHVYYNLRSMIVRTDESQRRVENLIKRIYKVLNHPPEGTHDISRILRPVGTTNFKDPDNPIVVRPVHQSATRHTLDALEAQMPTAPESQRQVRQRAAGSDDAPSLEEVRKMLSYVDAATLEYQQWVNILAAVHSVYDGDEGEELCREWSEARAEAGLNGTFDNQKNKWSTFTRDGEEDSITIGTLIHFAKLGGYERPRAFILKERDAAPEPAPAKLDEAAYYGLAGEIVRAIEPTTEADPAALLVSLLAAAGSIVGPGVHWSVSGKKHGLRVFPVLVGATGVARKGTSWGSLRQLLELVDADWCKRCVKSGLNSGEGLMWHVRDAIIKREPVREGNKRTGAIVGYEDVIEDQGVSDKRLFAIEEEFASVIKLMTREGNILSPIIRQAWDGGDLHSLVKKDATTVTDSHITILGHITQEELRRYMTDTEQANGFGNRFLWVCVKRSKLLPFGGEPDPATLAELGRRLQGCLTTAREFSRITRSAEANKIWRAVYPHLTRDRGGLLAKMVGRAEAQVMRLAAIYAILDASPTIEADHLNAALAVWQYCENSATSIFVGRSGDALEDRVLALITESEECTRNELRDALGRHVPSTRLSEILNTLEGRDAIKKETHTTGGRPSEVWRAT